MHSKLKKYNIAFLIINIIAVIAGTITFFVLSADDELFILFGFITLILGSLVAAFIYVILGTIVETGKNVENIQSKLSSLEEDLNKDKTGSGSTGNSSGWLFRNDEGSTKGPRKTASPGQWECRFCNRINYIFTDVCKCGHTKKESENKN